jgi:hypothetical protein
MQHTGLLTSLTEVLRITVCLLTCCNWMVLVTYSEAEISEALVGSDSNMILMNKIMNIEAYFLPKYIKVFWLF